jgi:hypothetical protein
MKTVTCPRCHGSGEVEENETLVGIAPILDRPSGVDDSEWTDPGQTRVTHVPSFKPFEGEPFVIPCERTPADATRIAHDSERPTAILPPAEARTAAFELWQRRGPKRRRHRAGFVLVLFFAGLALGLAAGATTAHWVPGLLRHYAAARSLLSRFSALPEVHEGESGRRLQLRVGRLRIHRQGVELLGQSDGRGQRTLEALGEHPAVVREEVEHLGHPVDGGEVEQAFGGLVVDGFHGPHYLAGASAINLRTNSGTSLKSAKQ